LDLFEAVDNFERATSHCDNLIEVHRGYGGPAQGRRDKEVSVNRAVVVIAVASWQAVIQDYTLACVDLSAPAPTGPLSPLTYNVLAGRVRQEVGAFSTPNAQNVRKLLIGAGFDPRPYWTWTQSAGQGQGMKTWKPGDADDRIDEWLKVRHAIAHGHDVLPHVLALASVRERPKHQPLANPTLRLADAEQCLAFFRRLTRLTGAGLAIHLGVDTP